MEIYINRIEPLGSRIIKISTYAPPAVSNDKATRKEAKQEYQDKLSATVKPSPTNNMIIVLGDMNARVIEPTNQKEKQE